MSYTEQVEAAAEDLKRGEDGNWSLARRTYENTLSGGERASLTGKATMAEWCSGVQARSGLEFGEQTGKIYRAVWRAWLEKVQREEDSVRPPWIRAYEEAYGKDFSAEAVAERFLPSRAKQIIERGSPELKRETFLRLAHDADVANPETIDRATEILESRQREVRGMPPIPPPMHPEQREAMERQDALGVGGAIDSMSLSVYILDARIAAQKYAQTLQRLGGLTDEERGDEATEIATVINAWTRLKEIVSQGSVAGSVDAFLATIRQQG